MGPALIASGAVIAVFAATVLWRWVPVSVGYGLTAAGGATTGAGALLVQEPTGAGSWAIALVALGFLTPVHVRALAGPPGAGLLPRRVSTRTKTGNPMSQRMDDPGLATQPIAAPAGPATVEPVPVRPAEPVVAPPVEKRRKLRKRARQTRVVIRKVGPWSVLKFSLLFYFCVMLVILLALGMLYSILGAMGVIDSLTDLLRSVGAGEDFQIHGDWIFTRLAVVGMAMVVIWSLINVFVAFLYNLISDVVGGIEVTLAERR